MLKYIESFDAVTTADLALSGLILPTWPVILPGRGRWGSSSLLVMAGDLSLPTIPRECTRLVLGLAVAGPPADIGCNSTVSSQYGSDVNGHQQWRYGSYGTRPALSVYFRKGTFVNFRVTVLLDTYGINVLCYTGSDGTGYPAIAAMPYKSQPFCWEGYTFVEVLVDVADYTNGICAVAINGSEIERKTGIYTAAYSGFGNDPADPRSKLDNILVNLGNITIANLAYSHTHYMIDSLYLCDDSGGYHNDFLGDIFVKTLLPAADGAKANWSPYFNSTIDEDAARVGAIDSPILDASGAELEYLQTDMDLSENMAVYDAGDIPDECSLIAVNHRTAFRNVASQGIPPPDTLVPVYQIAGNPEVVTNSLAMKVSGWVYSILDAYYDTVPGFAIPWTWLLLAQSEFGFLMREETWTGVQSDDLDFADEVIDE